MSRSLYSDDGEFLDLYRQAVECSIKGKRGQRFLRDLLAALDHMPVKRLIPDKLVTADGQVCALGCLGVARGLPMQGVSPESHQLLGRMFNVAESLIREVEFMNDGCDGYGWEITEDSTPEQRWTYMRKWVARQITEVPA